MSNAVFEMLASLATCLCAQIEEDGSPKPCFCGVVPGELALAEYIEECDDDSEDCGMAWVRLNSTYPSVTVGQPSFNVNNCGTELGLGIDLGIMRCISVGDAQGNSPSQDELLAATDQQIKDMLTMRRAVVCCPVVPTSDVLLGTYTPVGPSGGVVGGVWKITVNV